MQSIESASIIGSDPATSRPVNKLIMRFWSVDAVGTKGCMGQPVHVSVSLAGVKTVSEMHNMGGSLTRNI